jgi:H+/Cl- antiporter ClcA
MPLYSALRGLTKWDPTEHRVLAVSLVKWIALGSTVGVVSGCASALFLWSLDLVTRTRMAHVNLIFLLPLAGLVIGWVYSRYGRNVAGGNNVILDELHDGEGRVPLRMAPFVLAGTLVTHLFGGSAGREGTAVQMGGSLSDAIARLFRLAPADRRILLTSGVAGGFGSVFGTPMAGTVFAMEVTQVGGVRYEALVAAFAASMVGDLVVRAWGIGHTHYASLAGVELSPALLAKVALIGVAAGLVSRLFAELEHGFKAAFKTAVPWELLRPVIGGVIVVIAVFGFHAFDYIGIGTPMIVQSFTPGAVPPLSFLWKLLLTAITLGAGFQGGEVTPLFFIGATLGHTLGHFLGVPVALAAGTGFVAVFAGAANTPLACIIMGAELFGGGLPYLGLACIMAYMASGHAGIYTAQRVSIPKSKSLPVKRLTTLGALHHARKPVLPALKGSGDDVGEEAATD